MLAFDTLGSSSAQASIPSATFGEDVNGFGDRAAVSRMSSQPGDALQLALEVETLTPYPSAVSTLTEEAKHEIARLWVQMQELEGFVGGKTVKVYLQRTALSNAALSHEVMRSIWDMSDLDRDGRLSLREFVCAMHLAKLALGRHVLPGEVRREVQVALAAPVENLVALGLADAYPLPEKPIRSTEDWSTADTSGFQKTYGDSADFSIGGNALRSTPTLREPSSPLGPLGVREDGAEKPPQQGTLTGVVNLGQLSAVFEAVAQADDSAELSRMSGTVCEEREALKATLMRGREVEHNAKERRKEQVELAEVLRKSQVAAAACRRQIKHKQDELKEVENEIILAEAEIKALKEASNKNPPPTLTQGGWGNYGSAEEERIEVLARVRAEGDVIHKEVKAIKDMQVKLDTLYTERNELQDFEGSLLQRHQMIEQDRGLMLTSIEAEVKKLIDLREERVKMLEEREHLDRELADITQQTWADEHQVLPAPPADVGGSTRTATSSSHRMKGVPYDAVAVLEDLPYETSIYRQAGTETGVRALALANAGGGDTLGYRNNQVPAALDRGYPVDNRGYPVDNRGYPVDNRSYPVDNRGHLVDNRIGR